MGDAASRLTDALLVAGIAVSEVVVDHEAGFRPNTLRGFRFDCSIVCLNPAAIAGAGASSLLRSARLGPTIGLWFWEAGPLPESVHDAWSLVDEVWVQSAHCAHLLEPAPVLVSILPFVSTIPVPTTFGRGDLSIPDGPVVGFCADLRSGARRKNPQGVIDAFLAAFPNAGEASLVLKLNGAETPVLNELKRRGGGRRDIVIDDRALPEDLMSAWYQLIDCYVSLHRAEGLGLTVSLAMAAGCPAIATGWSGNLAFMDSANSELVPFRLLAVDTDSPYESNALWAEPDVEYAAAAMRRLVNNPVGARQLGLKGRQTLLERHDVGTCAAWLSTQLAPYGLGDRSRGQP